MLLPLLLFGLVLCAGITFGLALTVSRRKRHEIEQRLRLLPSASSESMEPEAAPGASPKPKSSFLKLERLLLLDRDHPWKLEVDPGKLTLRQSPPPH
jgi:hypothetical protein